MSGQRGRFWLGLGVFSEVGGCLLGEGGGGFLIRVGEEADTPLPKMATAVVGTHPTGMHSCVWLCGGVIFYCLK